VKKDYKSIAAAIEWADECLQLIEKKKRKKVCFIVDDAIKELFQKKEK